MSPVLAGAWADICWVVSLDAAYYPAAIAVGLAVVLDMATKLFALPKNNNGYRKAEGRRSFYWTPYSKEPSESFMAISLFISLQDFQSEHPYF